MSCFIVIILIYFCTTNLRLSWRKKKANEILTFGSFNDNFCWFTEANGIVSSYFYFIKRVRFQVLDFKAHNFRCNFFSSAGSSFCPIRANSTISSLRKKHNKNEYQSPFLLSIKTVKALINFFANEYMPTSEGQGSVTKTILKGRLRKLIPIIIIIIIKKKKKHFVPFNLITLSILTVILCSFQSQYAWYFNCHKNQAQHESASEGQGSVTKAILKGRLRKLIPYKKNYIYIY